jgi:hypothetical protein
MKNIIVISLFLLASIQAFPQITKKYEVVKTLASQINDIVSLDDNGNVESHLFHFMGQNKKYVELIDIVTIYYGNAKEMLNFFEDLESYAIKFKDEDEISFTVFGRRVTHVKKYGMRCCYIDSADKSGYIDIMDKDITKYKNKLIEYCNKNNIDISE